MGERNDLIERLHTAAKWAFEVKSDCEVSAVGARGHGSKFYAFSEECEETAKSAHRAFCVTEDAVDALRARDATIASLSEALAEAEKKGVEARLQALEDAIGAIRTAAVTTTLTGDDAASFCNGADWMEGEAIKVIRNLSQGGQHG